MLVEEKTMKTEKIYEGRIISLRVDTIELPNKKYSKREVVEHPGSVGVVALNDKGEIILVKQYRKAVERFMLEIPAGKLEINEEPRDTARRELQEETGLRAGKLDYLFEFYPSPGIMNEKIHVFLARDLEEGEDNLDSEEYIEIIKMDIDELERLITRGDILDSKTILGFNSAMKYLKNESQV